MTPVLDKEEKEEKDLSVNRVLEPGPTIDLTVLMNNVEMTMKQYLGIGPLMVKLSHERGEAKAFPGDWVFTFGGEKFILPDVLVQRSFNKHADPMPEFLERKVLNNKSGPDKFTGPIEELGGLSTGTEDPNRLSTVVLTQEKKEEEKEEG